jgi:hypothetical protein
MRKGRKKGTKTMREKERNTERERERVKQVVEGRSKREINSKREKG